MLKKISAILSHDELRNKTQEFKNRIHEQTRGTIQEIETITASIENDPQMNLNEKEERR